MVLSDCIDPDAIESRLEKGALQQKNRKAERHIQGVFRRLRTAMTTLDVATSSELLLGESQLVRNCVASRAANLLLERYRAQSLSETSPNFYADLRMAVAHAAYINALVKISPRFANGVKFPFPIDREVVAKVGAANLADLYREQQVSCYDLLVPGLLLALDSTLEKEKRLVSARLRYQGVECLLCGESGVATLHSLARVSLTPNDHLSVRFETPTRNGRIDVHVLDLGEEFRGGAGMGRECTGGVYGLHLRGVLPAEITPSDDQVRRLERAVFRLNKYDLYAPRSVTNARRRVLI